MQTKLVEDFRSARRRPDFIYFSHLQILRFLHPFIYQRSYHCLDSGKFSLGSTKVVKPDNFMDIISKALDLGFRVSEKAMKEEEGRFSGIFFVSLSFERWKEEDSRNRERYTYSCFEFLCNISR